LLGAGAQQDDDRGAAKTPVPLPDSPESIDALYLALLLSKCRGRATEVGDIKIVPFKSSAHLYTVVVRWRLRDEHGI
jgi:hypothetical protein